MEKKLDKKLPRYLFSDADKIRRVLSNVLSNAVKYTARGKITVSVRTTSSATLLELSVKDTGLGMDDSELRTIFLPFAQAESAQESDAAGTGMGLTIAKRIWELLDGEIEVKSKKGAGTTFTMTLPVKEAAPEEKKKLAQSRKPPPKTPSRAGAKSTILLVDDNLDNQYATKFILEDRGYVVDFADNGAQGVEKAKAIKPSLILLDMKMPGMDGYQAAKKIRAASQLKEVPIIAMTALSPQEDGGKARKAGCNDYLVKPFTLDQITEKVEQWLR